MGYSSGIKCFIGRGKYYGKPAGAVCTGTSVTFSATPSQNNLSPSYQWQVNGGNVGSNSSTYTTSSLNNGDVVTCILSSSANCVTGSPATSNAITVLVSATPTITGTTDASFCGGSSVSLGASASSGIINWYSVSTGGSSLSTGASFTISGLSATTTYYVDATANGCVSASRTAVTATYYPNSPNQPGAITGPVVGSRDSAATYSISTVPNTASYFWTVTIGVITSGQGTTSINVLWPDTVGQGTVSVVANSPCGTSAAQSVLVNVGTKTFLPSGTGRTGTLQSFIAPTTGNYVITAYGAQGGSYCGNNGGNGAEMQGTFALTSGRIIKILVGQQTAQMGYGGGGGGTFVIDSITGPLVIAGGGGGAYCGGAGSPGNTGTGGINGTGGAQGTGGDNGGGGGGGSGYGGAGGGGYCGNGGNASTPYCGGGTGFNGCGNGADGNCSPCTGSGGQSYLNGGAGGSSTCYPSNGDGGYGGGGASLNGNNSGAGGGGYSGGGGGGYGGSNNGYGGGGGSFNGGNNQTNISGVQTSSGKVVITW